MELKLKIERSGPNPNRCLRQPKTYIVSLGIWNSPWSQSVKINFCSSCMYLKATCNSVLKKYKCRVFRCWFYSLVKRGLYRSLNSDHYRSEPDTPNFLSASSSCSLFYIYNLILILVSQFSQICMILAFWYNLNNFLRF